MINLLKNKAVIVATAILIVVVVSIRLATPKPKVSPPVPVVSNLQTQVGKRLSDLQNLPQTAQKKPDGSVEYHTKTFDASRDDLLVGKDNLVVYERRRTVKKDGRYPILNDFQSQLKEPEEKFIGSAHFGEEVITYIYPAKGYALIVNPYNQQVYEIQSFKPTSLGEYKKSWGDDFYTYPQIHNDP